MPSAAEYDRLARTSSARANELRELATSIRVVAAPLATSFDRLTSSHLEGMWMSEAAQRSRAQLRTLHQTCSSSFEDTQSMVRALERAATGYESDARTARRKAETERRAEERERVEPAGVSS